MNPFPLPPHHVPSLRRWLLGALMSIANRQRDTTWYQLKAKLLPRFGLQVGYDLQIIKNKCWNCDGAGCRRCSSGIYSITRTKLQRWNVGGWIMHTPEKSIYFQHDFDALTHGAHSIIPHRICHGDKSPLLSRELQLWFLLLFDLRAFWAAFRSMRYCRTWPYPLLSLQRFHNGIYWEIQFARTHRRWKKQTQHSLGAAYTNDIPF